MGVIILGLDGMTWEVVEPLMEAGRLPAFRALCDGGAWGVLESTVPPVTATAWASMLTGKNPARHGVWGFLRPQPEKGPWEFGLITHFDYEATPLWRILQRFGRRGAFFNVPCAFPLDPHFSAGVLTSGYLTPTTGREFAYPRAFRERLLARHPDFEFKLNWIRTGLRDLVSRGIQIARVKFDVIRELRCEGPWDVLFVVIDEPDTIQHALWTAILRRERAVLEFYEFLDREIGRLVGDLARTGDTLFIVSDHGFRSVSSLFAINEALERAGYLVFRQRRSPVVIRGMLIELARRFPVTAWAIEQYRRHVPGKRIQPMVPPALSSTFRSFRAVAVRAGGTSCGVYADRQDPESVERLDRDLSRVTQRFPDVEILKAADLYHGQHFAELPPLVAITKGTAALTTDRQGTLTRSIPLVGEHSPAGLLIASGPAIQQGSGISMHIYDVLPTVLRLLDLPIPNDLDGRAAAELFSDPRPSRMYDVRTGALLDSPATGTLVRDRLRNLALGSGERR